METPAKEIARLLEGAIERSTHTKKEIAEIADISYAALRQYCNGERIPRIDTAWAIGRACGAELLIGFTFPEHTDVLSTAVMNGGTGVTTGE